MEHQHWLNISVYAQPLSWSVSDVLYSQNIVRIQNEKISLKLSENFWTAD